ncbi:MalY/PatB family protein [Microbacterium sp. A93]|uniref:MalY/PatB family protein n=1 Tax=Microbacterium sp. A93 TaxID=3450716 RepID=UPI003F4352F1
MELSQRTADRATARVRSLKWADHPGKIGAWIAESDFGTAPAVVEALQAAIGDEQLAYVPSAVGAAAESACADLYRDRFGWAVGSEYVHLIPDVLTGLRITIEHFTRPGTAVIVPTPAYMPFLTVPESMGREVIQVPMRRSSHGWSLDLSVIERHLADGAGLLILCNPHNPLGTVMPVDEMNALSHVVERHGARVFADEIHAPVVYAGSTHVPYASTSPGAAAHTITAFSASKGWNIAGLKSAQLIFSGDVDNDRWQSLGLFPTYSNSILGAIGTCAAYTSGRDWLDGTLRQFEENRDLVVNHFEACGLPVGLESPEATYLAWINLRAFEFPSLSPAGYLSATSGVVVSDGAACGEVGRGYVRLNFAMPATILQTALSRITDALRDLPTSITARS